ncbi:MAG TPA: hypothetical protein VMT87_17235 [Vicinamibacteria bacterium]|nr:hypothetical protein [Vicinamibacteria bacterium]
MKAVAKWPALSLALVSVLVLAACGGGSPLSPSASGPQVVLRGTVLGAASASGAQASSARASSASVTVSVVEDPTITATVAADGSFTLRGLPEGSFTLLFKTGDTVLGVLAFSSVLPNQEITITVDVSSGSVALVDEQRTGIGHGDVEIEGLVEAILPVPAGAPAGENRFQIRGTTVVTRPGVTAIREGNQARTPADVTVGRRVHVKAVWLPEPAGSGAAQPALAHEIILQDDDEDDGANQACIAGGRVGESINLEGRVAGGNSLSFELTVNGNRAAGPVQVDGSGASFQCAPASGPNAVSPAQCKAKVVGGAKVNVSGTLTSCEPTAMVTARKVIVQGK